VLRDLIRDQGLTASSVKRLTARMPDTELEIVNNREMPDICVQHLLAVMLLDGNVTFASAHDFARMQDPAVLELRKRIEVVGDPALTDAQRRWRCVMEVELADGSTLRHETMAAKGSFENPLTRDEEEEKALDLIVPVLGKARSSELLAQLWNCEAIADVRILRPLYQS
jgi:2-methylcitrate dehydratase PrpD